MHENIRKFILFVGDVAALYGSLYLALLVRHGALVTAQQWAEHWTIFTTIFMLWLLIFYIAGLYNISNLRADTRSFVSFAHIMGINFLFAITYFYLVPNAQLTPKTLLLITVVMLLILMTIWRRYIFPSIFSKKFKRNALIVGDSDTAQELARLLDTHPQYGMNIAAVLHHNATDHHGNLPDYRNPKDLEEVITKHDISIIVLDKQSRTSEKLIANLFQHLDQRLEFISLDFFYESITKRISLETIDRFWFLQNLQENEKRFTDASKRCIDIVCAVLFCIPSIVIIPFLGLLILIQDGRPIFFTQMRLGKNGKSFKAIKLRSMSKHAEKNGPQFAQKNDPRITPLGKWLRKLRLDELPQLWNIIRGEMSFVGPRPERPEFVETLEKEIPFYRERLLVKPGLTGWDQISGEYHSGTKQDSLKKLQYDLYYVKNRSLILDLGIILKTIKTVLTAGGR